MPSLSAQALARKIEKIYGVELRLVGYDHVYVLDKLVVPKGSRREGVGTDVMEQITWWADNEGYELRLTPSVDFGATSVPRLKKFYKRFGFVENRGKNRDYSHQESMYRLPKGADTFVENPPWSTNLIAENMDEMIEAGLPFPTGPDEELGEGHYGVVYATNDPEVVFKVTSDPTEAEFIKRATPLGWPQGIVKYKAIIDFEGGYQGRATYGIWREAAFPVGLYKADANTAYDENNKREFEKYLQLFKRTAALARDTIQKKPRMLEYALSEKGKRWAWDALDFDWIDPRTQKNKIYSHRMADQPLSRFVGWQRIAIALRACEAIAEMMEHNNPMSSSVGAALQFYLDNGILLADVHSNNVGKVQRDDEWGEQTLWVITDPGHAVFLDDL